jgi:uncharacterized repeat protein (TIGR04042 family)
VNYSPSTVVREYFAPGATYDVDEFIRLSRNAMQAASDRVAAVYGHPCSRAGATLAAIEQRASTYLAQPEAAVTVIGFKS